MVESTPTSDIYHVTCIAGNLQKNLDFWVETLGFRFARCPVNQDDPSTYHLLFTDVVGTPGTSMAPFPRENLLRRKVGTGQVSRTAFRVPEGSLDYWEDRLDEYDVDYGDRAGQFGETALPLSDPDDLPVGLVEVGVPDNDPTVPWIKFAPEDVAIRGSHSVMLWPANPRLTEDLLETTDLERVGTEGAQGNILGGERTRFAVTGSVGKHVDVLPITESGRQSLGTVHHVAFQIPTGEDQEVTHKAVQPKGLHPTIQVDRHWFRLVYSREFGGVLFELVTNDPGYTTGEPPGDLGGCFALPGEFGGRREQIEAGLTDVTIPRVESTEADS